MNVTPYVHTMFPLATYFQESTKSILCIAVYMLSSRWCCCAKIVSKHFFLLLQLFNSPNRSSLVRTPPESGHSNLAPVPSASKPHAPWRWHSADASSPISAMRAESFWTKLKMKRIKKIKNKNDI